MNLDLAARDDGTLRGVVVGCGWFLWFSRKLLLDLLWSSF